MLRSAVVALLLFGAACSSSHHAPTPSIPCPDSSPCRTPVRTPTRSFPAELAACKPAWISITSAGGQGITGGGIGVFVDLTTTQNCRVRGQPRVMIVDAKGRVITSGMVSTHGSPTATDVLRPGGQTLVGEWRNVCTPATPPLRLRLLIDNEPITHQMTDPKNGVPVCYDANGAPTTPKASRPSGYLRLLLEENGSL